MLAADVQNNHHEQIVSNKIATFLTENEPYDVDKEDKNRVFTTHKNKKRNTEEVHETTKLHNTTPIKLIEERITASSTKFDRVPYPKLSVNHAIHNPYEIRQIIIKEIPQDTTQDQLNDIFEQRSYQHSTPSHPSTLRAICYLPNELPIPKNRQNRTDQEIRRIFPQRARQIMALFSKRNQDVPPLQNNLEPKYIPRVPQPSGSPSNPENTGFIRKIQPNRPTHQRTK